MTAAFPYFGGKARLVDCITSYFPPHHTFVDLFGGAANLVLNKTPAFLDVYNDRAGDLVNFWRVLRDRPRDLVAAIEATPYSRASWEAAYRATADPLCRALNLYVISWQQRHGGKGGMASGWRKPPASPGARDPRDQWRSTRHLFAASRRLQGLVGVACR